MFELIDPPYHVDCPADIDLARRAPRPDAGVIMIEAPSGAHELRINGVDGAFPASGHACLAVHEPADVVFEYAFHDQEGDFLQAGVYIGADMQREWLAPPDGSSLDRTFAVQGRERPAHVFVPERCVQGGCPLIVGGDLFSSDVYAHVAWRLIETERIRPVVLASTFPDFANRILEYRRPEHTQGGEAFDRHLSAFADFVCDVSSQFNAGDLYVFGFSNGGEFALNFAARGRLDVSGVLAVSPYDQTPTRIVSELGSRSVATHVAFGSWEDLPREAYETGHTSVENISGGHAKHLAALAFESYLLSEFGE